MNWWFQLCLSCRMFPLFSVWCYSDGHNFFLKAMQVIQVAVKNGSIVCHGPALLIERILFWEQRVLLTQSSPWTLLGVTCTVSVHLSSVDSLAVIEAAVQFLFIHDGFASCHILSAWGGPESNNQEVSTCQEQPVRCSDPQAIWSSHRPHFTY